jgi:hypothetical protein
MTVRDLPPFRSKEHAESHFAGRVQNVSKGGICFLSQQPVRQSSLLLCEIGVTEMPVPVPTVLSVRWTKKQPVQPAAYLSGLQFLF